MIENNREPLIEQTESVKLIKNTKGYNWEIKILNHDLVELKRLNDELEKMFGNKPEDIASI